jgi:uncharacterized SAM-binding protein YcdF (DUF218 family)
MRLDYSRPVALLRPITLWLLALALVVSATASWAGGEAIVVLGTRVEADGTPGPMLRSRLEVARRLAAKQPRALVIVTGGAVANGVAEGPAMASWLQNHGISKARIRVESRARHTGENADFVAPMLAANGIDRVTVVTSRFHVPRSLFHFRSALSEQGLKGKIKVSAAPAADGLSGVARLRKNVRERGAIVRDARKRMARRLRQRMRRPAARGKHR